MMAVKPLYQAELREYCRYLLAEVAKYYSDAPRPSKASVQRMWERGLSPGEAAAELCGRTRGCGPETGRTGR